ncbi:MAG: formylglycine-generating enzyme family protein [Kiritimatiellaeota bacterium]|nr:formylglycine-generating enzyme family protein [Kiritimatiellota bacterium]
MKKLLPALATLAALALHAEPALYKVVDLSAGPDADTYPVRDSDVPPDIERNVNRTTELWLRYAPPGKFMMGSPADEAGRAINEHLHEVTLTAGFYIGVFEVTQRQWELVMGANPSTHKDDTHPVETVSYQDIRGKPQTARWPENDVVDDGTFMDRLRKRTGLHFDLPLEAQWEYACRAGVTNAFNNGASLTATPLEEEEDPAMNKLGRYEMNHGDGRGEKHVSVGFYAPNAWGLYDMHGNVAEWCRDAYLVYPRDNAPRTDPVGDPNPRLSRVLRGGHWESLAQFCRSAKRESIPSDLKSPNYGLRVVATE